MKHDLEQLYEELEVALGGLDATQTQLRPDRGASKWSVQQIVSHLLRTYSATEKAMDGRIAKGRSTQAKVTPVQIVSQFFLLRVGYFPAGRAAPDVVKPSEDEESAPSGILIAQIHLALSAMNRKLLASEALFGAKSRSVNHMVLGPLSVDQWARFHLAHGRHHIKQILAIRKSHGV